MFKTDNLHVLVVGGGKVAFRKVKALLEAGARVTVISPHVCDEMRELIQDGKLEWINGSYQGSCLKEGFRFVVVACGGDAARKVRDDCHERGILCNVVDAPDMCDFVFPAVVRKGHLLLAISTSALAPVIAAEIRRILEGVITEDISGFIEEIHSLRRAGKKVDRESIRAFLRELFSRVSATLETNGSNTR